MLHGKTIGIIGFGEVTRKAVPLFNKFDCEVLVFSEHLSDAEAQGLKARKASISEVLLCDVVSVQRGLSERTKKSFGEKEINSLRSGAVFINSARAGLVDNGALIKRLKKGDMFACLDVFDKEPLSRNSELRKLPNVFLTSHIAGSLYHTEGLLSAANKSMVVKLVSYFDGKSVSMVQGREHLENMT